MDLLLLLILLGLSAALSGSETAFFSLGAAERARLATQGGKAGKAVMHLLERANDLLSALLIGNLLVNTAASVVTTSLCLAWFGPRGLVVAVPAATLALLLFGEITPKMLALRSRRKVVLLAQRPLRGWLVLTGPLLRVIAAGIGLLLRILPLERAGSRHLSTEELQIACDLAVEDGTLTETEGRSLARLLNLEDLEVVEIMTPRTDVVILRRDMSLKQVLATARRAGYNRYPVLDPDGDRPVGLFHLKDLLAPAPDPERPLTADLRPLLYVPESKDVAALLEQMGAGGAHLAAVVDEHGDFTGIVTMANCLQALMGPAADATGSEDDLIHLGAGRWVISGRTDLRQLQESCGILLPASRDYLTIAGFLMARLGRVLQPGDQVTLPEARLTVLEMSGLRADRIQVTLRPTERPQDEQEGP